MPTWRPVLPDKDNLNRAGLCLAWVLMVAVCWPTGNFPLNDDWSYGESVRTLVEQGKLQFSGWVGMPLVGQVLWGALFCLPTGFSFATLRVASLVAGLIGVLALYELIREIKGAPTLAFVGALAMAVNPLFFNLANTFMTDVPACSVSIVSTLVFARGLRRNTSGAVIAGILLALFGVLIRQSGVALLLGFSVGYLVRRGVSKPSLIRAAVIASLGPVCLLGYRLILWSTIGVPALYDLQMNAAKVLVLEDPRGALTQAVTNGLAALLYIALFTLPFLVAALPTQMQRATRRTCAIAALSSAAVLACVASVVWWRGLRFPLLENVLHTAGLGPLTLRDTFFLGASAHYHQLPASLWAATTVAAVVAVGLLAFHGILIGVRALREPHPHRVPLVIVLAVALSYLFPLLVVHLFDRYLLLLVPLTIVAVTPVAPNTKGVWFRLATSVGCALAFLFLTFSVAATHDYISWNRARWTALGRLVNDAGIKPSSIDGGFEFNGWYCYSRDYKVVEGRSWWWVEDDEYLVTFGPVPGYKVHCAYSFRRMLPGRPGTLLVLKRQ